MLLYRTICLVVLLAASQTQAGNPNKLVTDCKREIEKKDETRAKLTKVRGKRATFRVLTKGQSVRSVVCAYTAQGDVTVTARAKSKDGAAS